MEILNKISTPILSALLFLTFVFRSPIAAVAIVLVLAAYVCIYMVLSQCGVS